MSMQQISNDTFGDSEQVQNFLNSVLRIQEIRQELQVLYDERRAARISTGATLAVTGGEAGPFPLNDRLLEINNRVSFLKSQLSTNELQTTQRIVEAAERSLRMGSAATSETLDLENLEHRDCLLEKYVVHEWRENHREFVEMHSFDKADMVSIAFMEHQDLVEKFILAEEDAERRNFYLNLLGNLKLSIGGKYRFFNTSIDITGIAQDIIRFYGNFEMPEMESLNPNRLEFIISTIGQLPEDFATLSLEERKAIIKENAQLLNALKVLPLEDKTKTALRNEQSSLALEVRTQLMPRIIEELAENTNAVGEGVSEIRTWVKEQRNKEAFQQKIDGIKAIGKVGHEAGRILRLVGADREAEIVEGVASGVASIGVGLATWGGTAVAATTTTTATATTATVATSSWAAFGTAVMPPLAIISGLVTIASVFFGRKKDKSMQVLFQALQHIQQLILDVRREIHERFDVIDRRLHAIHVDLFEALERLDCLSEATTTTYNELLSFERDVFEYYRELTRQTFSRNSAEWPEVSRSLEALESINPTATKRYMEFVREAGYWATEEALTQGSLGGQRETHSLTREDFIKRGVLGNITGLLQYAKTQDPELFSGLFPRKLPNPILYREGVEAFLDWNRAVQKGLQDDVEGTLHEDASNIRQYNEGIVGRIQEQGQNLHQFILALRQSGPLFEHLTQQIQTDFNQVIKRILAIEKGYLNKVVVEPIQALIDQEVSFLCRNLPSHIQAGRVETKSFKERAIRPLKEWGDLHFRLYGERVPHCMAKRLIAYPLLKENMRTYHGLHEFFPMPIHDYHYHLFDTLPKEISIAYELGLINLRLYYRVKAIDNREIKIDSELILVIYSDRLKKKGLAVNLADLENEIVLAHYRNTNQKMKAILPPGLQGEMSADRDFLQEQVDGWGLVEVMAFIIPSERDQFIDKLTENQRKKRESFLTELSSKVEAEIRKHHYKFTKQLISEIEVGRKLYKALERLELHTRLLHAYTYLAFPEALEYFNFLNPNQCSWLIDNLKQHLENYGAHPMINPEERTEHQETTIVPYNQPSVVRDIMLQTHNRLQLLKVYFEHLVNARSEGLLSVLASHAPEIEGLSYSEVIGDGHCLFRSIAIALGQEGTNEDVQSLRNRTADFMLENSEDFREFLPEGYGGDINRYAEDLRNNLWGGDPEINAFERLLEIPLIVIEPRHNRIPENWELFPKEPIFLYFNGINHYNVYRLNEGADAREVLRHFSDTEAEEVLETHFVNQRTLVSDVLERLETEIPELLKQGENREGTLSQTNRTNSGSEIAELRRENELLREDVSELRNRIQLMTTNQERMMEMMQSLVSSQNQQVGVRETESQEERSPLREHGVFAEPSVNPETSGEQESGEREEERNEGFCSIQ